MSSVKMRKFYGFAVVALICSACGGSGSGTDKVLYSVSGTVTGLQGAGLVLKNSATGEALPVGTTSSSSAAVQFTFARGVAAGQPYTISVSTQPTNPSQTCTATSNAGTIPAGGGDVSNVGVGCVTNTYSVGGTITNYNGSGGLVLSLHYGNNAGKFVAPNSGDAGFSPTAISFVFTADGTPGGSIVRLLDATQYSVSVVEPSDTTINCTVDNPYWKGTIRAAPVTQIVVTCRNAGTNLYVTSQNHVGESEFFTPANDYPNGDVRSITIGANGTLTMADYRLPDALIGPTPPAGQQDAGPITFDPAFGPTLPYGYVASSGTGELWAYARTGNLLTALGTGGNAGQGVYPVPVSFGPRTKSGAAFAYVPARLSNSIAGFSIAPDTGIPTPIGMFPSPGGPFQTLAITPDGRFAYVGNTDSHTVSAFTIDTDTGALSTVQGSPYPAGDSTLSVTLHPNGKFLYALNSKDSSIVTFAINQSTGALTALGPNVSDPGVKGLQSTSLVTLVFDPTVTYVFVPNTASNNLSVYKVNNDGTLSSAPGSPLWIAGAVAPASVTVDPSGRFVFVANTSSQNISVFSVNQQISGNETALSVVGLYALQGTPALPLSVDPSGKYLYASSQPQPAFPGQTQVDLTPSINGYIIDPNSGALVVIAGTPFPLNALIAPNSPTIVRNPK